MPVKLIQDGQNIADFVQPQDGERLHFTFRPPLSFEIAEHREKYSRTVGAERERVRLTFLASRIVAWDVEGSPPINAETLARLPAAYLDPIEDRILGYVVKRADDEKKS